MNYRSGRLESNKRPVYSCLKQSVKGGGVFWALKNTVLDTIDYDMNPHGLSRRPASLVRALILMFMLLAPLSVAAEEEKAKCRPDAGLLTVLRETQQPLSLHERLARLIAPSRENIIRKRFGGDPSVMDIDLVSAAWLAKINAEMLGFDKHFKSTKKTEWRKYVLSTAHPMLRQQQISSLSHGETVYLHTKRGDRITGRVVIVRETPRKVALLTNERMRSVASSKNDGKYYLLELNWNQIDAVARNSGLHEVAVRSAGLVSDTKQFAGRNLHEPHLSARKEVVNSAPISNEHKLMPQVVRPSMTETTSVGSYTIYNQQSVIPSDFDHQRLIVQNSATKASILDLKISPDELWTVQLAKHDGLLFVTRHVRDSKAQHRRTVVELWDISNGRQLLTLENGDHEAVKVLRYSPESQVLSLELRDGKQIVYEIEKNFDWNDI